MSKESEILVQLKTTPEAVTFSDVIEAIEANYTFTPTSFNNGSLHNEAGQNSGSCKVFAFAQLHALSPEQTLQLFGDYYRKDVLLNPTGSDHQNIRNFMKTGWKGIEFSAKALQKITP
ncbi:HopJ type III effector protein [Catenovulum sediminis]|uniref:HopJ type III effector protein n=1 Tax=Catenovulum sediminis TaxID=1740262 RepID=A0ABV1RKI2_9ALTE